jgi:hypothetical protein
MELALTYPKEYRELYEGFKDGSTIREWVNKVESLAHSVVPNHDPLLNIQLLKARLKGDWNMVVSGKVILAMCTKAPESDIDILKYLGKPKELGWVLFIPSVENFNYSDGINKFKGDMLEVFAEMFFTNFGCDEGIGLKDYTPIIIGDDFGVDATGINVNGHKCAIQVKYRKNPSDLITYADIARTFTSAVLQLGIADVVAHDHTVFLFTISNGVTGAFEKVMGKKAVVVSKGIISTKVDNNKTFWERCNETMKKTLN